MHTLVNRHIRDKISKEESRKTSRPATANQPQTEEKGQDNLEDETFQILFQDQLQERALIRVLLSFGSMNWSEGKTVADYIFEEEMDEEMFKNKKVPEIINLYRFQSRSGNYPGISDFAYSEDSEIVKLVIESTNHPYELSHRWYDEDRAHSINREIWKLNYENFRNKVMQDDKGGAGVYSRNFSEQYKADVEAVLVYLKLKKIKRLMLLNEEDLKKPNSTAEEIKHFQEVHSHLKLMQIELTKKKGTVLYPF